LLHTSSRQSISGYTDSIASRLPEIVGDIMADDDWFYRAAAGISGAPLVLWRYMAQVNDLAVSGATPLYLTLNAFS